MEKTHFPLPDKKQPFFHKVGKQFCPFRGTKPKIWTSGPEEYGLVGWTTMVDIVWLVKVEENATY